MRKLSTLLLPVIAGALVVTVLPATAAGAKQVPAPLFGQHISGITSGVPATLPRVGSIRLWDAGVTWRQVEVADNKYDWSRLDAAVANARRLGASEILYTLGSTPKWAATASSLKASNARLALYGAGSNSHPRSDAFFTDYLRAVAQRYKGRITAYQMWNEANLHEFYLGSPKQMAKLTKKAAKALNSVDRGAKLVAASTTVRSYGLVGKFGRAYGKAMRKAKAWKAVDAVSAHFYPPATEGPNTRVKYIKIVKKYYKRYGAKRKPLWDTEVNYGDLRSYMKVKREYTGATAATYVARTYIDSMRYGLPRVFWYGWDIHVLGTGMVTRDSRRALAPGGAAFLEVQKWMAGAKWYGCRTKKKITTCTIRPRGQAKQTIRYTTKKSKMLTIGKGVSTIRRLDGSSTPVQRGQKVRITTQPVLLAP